MSMFVEDQERRLIPRWRFTNDTAFSLEYACDPTGWRPSTVNRSFLEEKLSEWKLSPSIGNAIDLLSCGLSGRWLEEVRPAAEFLAQNNESLSSQVKTLIDSINLPSEQTNFSKELSCGPESMFKVACTRAATARSRLRRDPRNAFGWLDLARAYTILGQRQKAITSIERALYLTPFHRHVLRSAVRLFIHVGQKDRAHRLLVRNPRTPSDPWLVAAELATAKVGDRSPRFARCGRRLINSGGLPPGHLTELQSSIATLEFYDGSERNARKNLRASLVAPTDNAVAQARWLGTKLPGIVIEETVFSLPLGYEARCWRALIDGRWDDAQFECRRWLTDETYSRRPAKVASFIGVALTTDYTYAKDCAKIGLQASPTDSTLINNLSVALAYGGEIDAAFKNFQKIKIPLQSDFPPYVFVATGGLLRFRLGDIDGGRRCYSWAERLAPKKMKHMVTIFRAREEQVASTKEAPDYLERAFKTDSNDLYTRQLQVNLKEQSQQLRLQGSASPPIPENADRALSWLNEHMPIDDDHHLGVYLSLGYRTQ